MRPGAASNPAHTCPPRVLHLVCCVENSVGLSPPLSRLCNSLNLEPHRLLEPLARQPPKVMPKVGACPPPRARPRRSPLHLRPVTPHTHHLQQPSVAPACYNERPPPTLSPARQLRRVESQSMRPHQTSDERHDMETVSECCSHCSVAGAAEEHTHHTQRHVRPRGRVSHKKNYWGDIDQDGRRFPLRFVSKEAADPGR